MLLLLLLPVMALLKPTSLHCSFFDLGVYAWKSWTIAHGGLQQLFFEHAMPGLGLGGMLYAVFPSLYALLLLQSLLLLLPACCMYRVWRRTGADREAIWLVAYAAFFPVWYIGLFDFHVDALVLPLGYLFYQACFRERWGWAAASALTLCLVKEPYALSAAMCGAYLALKHRRWGMGAAVFLAGLAYFYAAMRWLIPLGSPQRTGVLGGSAFSWMGGTMGEQLGFILTHPLEVAAALFTPPGKTLYLLALFGSLAMAPLFAPLELMPALPQLAISLLSRQENYHALGHHYTAALVMPLTVAFAVGLPRALHAWERAGRRRGVLLAVAGFCLLAGNVLVSPSPVSRLFWTDKVWSYGWRAYLPTSRDRAIAQAITETVPPDPDVVVSCQNTLAHSRLFNRRLAYSFPEAVLQPQALPDFLDTGRPTPELAQYVVLDLRRPLYLVDKGCQWRSGPERELRGAPWDVLFTQAQGPPVTPWLGCGNAAFTDRFADILTQTLREFEPVRSFDGFAVLRRRTPTPDPDGGSLP